MIRSITRLITATLLLCGLALPAHADDKPTEVKLLDAGKGTKTALRLNLKAGTIQKVTMTMDMAMAMNINGQQAPSVELPPVIMTLGVRVVAVKKNGDIDFEAAFGRATLGEGGAPEVRAAMEQELGGLDGLKMVGTMTNRGLNKSVRVSGKDGLSQMQKKLMDDMERSIKQLSQPFPEQKVGVGARWTTKATAVMNNIPMTTESQFELLSLKGDAYQIKAHSKVGTSTREVQLPGTPIPLTIEKLDGTGSGTSNGSLSQPMPGRSKVKSSIALALSGAAQGEKISLQMSMKMTMSIAPTK